MSFMELAALSRIEANQLRLSRNQTVLAANQVALSKQLVDVARLVGGDAAALSRIETLEQDIMTQTSDLATQLTADAARETNAFVALKGVMDAQGAQLKAALDKIASGVAVDDPAVVAQLKAVHDSMTGTNGDMVAAATLAGTPAATQVPPAPAATAAAVSGT